MPDAERQAREAPAAANEAPAKGGKLKPLLVILVAFALQIVVVFVVLQLAKPRSAGAAAADGKAGATGSTAPIANLAIVDLGSYNVTQFDSHDPVNLRQLSVSLAVTVPKGDNGEKAPAADPQQRVTDQKAWVAQLLDEILGAADMTAVHASRREDLKRQLRERINKRLGEDLVKEVIIRIQAFTG